MKYCKKCLQPDTRPGISFNTDDICPACTYQEKDKSVDWRKREYELEKIVKFARDNSSNNYDCIIGVSGGKDSTRQSLFVRDVLKLKPLLVMMSYPPDQLTIRGANNASNLISLGFDCITCYPSPTTWKFLMKKGFFNYSNWAKSTEFALFSSVPKIAIDYKIPLIWWGENPAHQLGDLNTLGKNGYDGNSLRKMNTLSGDSKWMLDKHIHEEDILQYMYPTEKDFIDNKIQIVFLSYFWKEWSLVDNGIFSALRGLEISQDSPAVTGDLYGISALDEDWVPLNQMIKYLKFGFGKITDFVNEEIRNNKMSRSEAIELCEKYDGKCSDQSIDSFCEYIEITKKEFWATVNKSVNLSLFNIIDDGIYTPKFKVGYGIKS